MNLLSTKPLWVLLLLFCGALHATELGNAVAQCDALAAHPNDATKPENVAGVPFDELDGKGALIACEAAFAQSPSPRMQYQLARALEVNKKVELARAGFLAAADNGHRRAMFSLGYSYWDARLGSYEPKKALRWFRRAAAAGETDAMFNIASAYLNGSGVKKSESQALKWFKKSAVNGDQEAQDWVRMLEQRQR